MSQKIGMNCKLFRNTGSYGSPTWVEVPTVRDATLSCERTEADASYRGGGGFENVMWTLMKINVEADMVWDTADAGFAAIRAAFFANTPIEFMALDGANSSGSQGVRATMGVGKFNRAEPLAGIAAAAISLKPYPSANNPAWVTI